MKETNTDSKKEELGKALARLFLASMIADDLQSDDDFDQGRPSDVLTEKECGRCIELTEKLGMFADDVDPEYLAALVLLSRYENINIEDHLKKHIKKS